MRMLHRLAEEDLAGATRFYKREAGLGVARRFDDDIGSAQSEVVGGPDPAPPATSATCCRWAAIKASPLSRRVRLHRGWRQEARLEAGAATVTAPHVRG